MIPKFDNDYDQIKYWYDNGFMSLKKVKNLVGIKITEDDYFQITGFQYQNENQTE